MKMYQRMFHVLLCAVFLSASLSQAFGVSVERREASNYLFKSEGFKAKFNHSQPPLQSKIVVDTSKSLHVISKYFMSIAIDTDQIKWKMRGFDFGSKKLQTLASALTPTYIRWGGTYADFLHFDPDAKEDYTLPQHWTEEMRQKDRSFDYGFFEEPFTLKNDTNFTMSGKMWDKITDFCEKVGWEIMFDFNLFFWKGNYWDPSNAIEILKYSAARRIKIPAFQLGNEPNGFHYNFNITVEPATLAHNYRVLRQVLSRFPQYDASGLYGPDVTSLASHGSARTYLDGFLQGGGCDAVTEVALHHYYLGARVATLKDFIDPDVLDYLKKELTYANNITFTNCKYYKPLRLTETSSCYGGGAPKMSNAFVAGFMWLDKLSLSAKFGVSTVFRQTFFEGSYSLIDMKLNPNPDYYLSLLFKRLIEGPVFHVISSEKMPKLRIYAHCARKDYYNYPDGSLVLSVINLHDQEVTLDMGQFSDSDLDLYMLTPGDSNGLLSRFVRLNGETLRMDGSDLPKMVAKHHSGDVTMAPLSFGFVVIPHADVHLCNIYHV